MPSGELRSWFVHIVDSEPDCDLRAAASRVLPAGKPHFCGVLTFFGRAPPRGNFLKKAMGPAVPLVPPSERPSCTYFRDPRYCLLCIENMALNFL